MKKYKIKLDEYDVRIVIRALNDLRNKQIEEGNPTDPVDEILIAFANLIQQ